MCSTLTMCSYSNLFSGRKSILPGELAQALQHASSGEIEQNIEVEQLCEKMTRCCDDLMLLDCRSFLAYNFKHIAGALNVNCTGIGRKRLQQGKASLVDLITSEYGKQLLKSGKWAKAVVYDESTVELEKAPSSHPVKLVMMSLLSQGKEALLLKGKIVLNLLYNLYNILFGGTLLAICYQLYMQVFVSCPLVINLYLQDE